MSKKDFEIRYKRFIDMGWLCVDVIPSVYAKFFKDGIVTEIGRMPK